MFVASPVSYEMMREPVVASDGHTYERAAIEQWLSQKDRSPMTNSVITRVSLRRFVAFCWCARPCRSLLVLPADSDAEPPVQVHDRRVGLQAHQEGLVKDYTG